MWDLCVAPAIWQTESIVRTAPEPWMAGGSQAFCCRCNRICIILASVPASMHILVSAIAPFAPSTDMLIVHRPGLRCGKSNAADGVAVAATRTNMRTWVARRMDMAGAPGDGGQTRAGRTARQPPG